MYTYDLKTKVIVVAGAGRGIGRSIAELFLAHGARVIMSSRTETEINSVLDTNPEYAERVIPVVADGANVDDSKKTAITALSEFGKIDGWVNCVGGHIGNDRDPLNCTAEIFMQTLQLNLTSAFLGSKLAAEAMLNQDTGGAIVNIGSGDSNHAGGRVAYTAAKHGLIGLTRSLAMHWGPAGVRVNCVCPAWTDTELNDWNLIGEDWGVEPEAAYNIATKQNAQHRMLDPQEVASTVCYLNSTVARGITGQILNVDGGYKL